VSDEIEACAFCRVGSCAIHHVHRLVSYGRGPKVGPLDEDMAPVGCCDGMQAAVELGVMRMHRRQLVLVAKGRHWTVKRCPFCESEGIT